MTTHMPPMDRRGLWRGITTHDGLTVEGSELDGFHVRRNGMVLASYYAPRHGDAGTCPLAALDRYRGSLEEARRMAIAE